MVVGNGAGVGLVGAKQARRRLANTVRVRVMRLVLVLVLVLVVMPLGSENILPPATSVSSSSASVVRVSRVSCKRFRFVVMVMVVAPGWLEAERESTGHAMDGRARFRGDSAAPARAARPRGRQSAPRGTHSRPNHADLDTPASAPTSCLGDRARDR
jgi:hypothetical protein